MSEIHLNLVMGDKINRKLLRQISKQQKLLEAAAKESNFDAYFSLAIVLQAARNTFIFELEKNADVFSE